MLRHLTGDKAICYSTCGTRCAAENIVQQIQKYKEKTCNHLTACIRQKSIKTIISIRDYRLHSAGTDPVNYNVQLYIRICNLQNNSNQTFMFNYTIVCVLEYQLHNAWQILVSLTDVRTWVWMQEFKHPTTRDAAVTPWTQIDKDGRLFVTVTARLKSVNEFLR